MKQLKKIWSLTAICGMIIGIFPMTIFAETITAANVVINQAEITTTEDQAITEDNPIKHKATVKTKLSWSLDQAVLIDEGTLTAVNLPANLNFPDQAGSLGEMGNYQVSNQQLLFQFNKNYQETEDGRAPDFASAKFYEGIVELTAETTAEDVETETVDFGNNLVSTLYYDKKVDPAADPLGATEAAQKIQPQTHNPSLNERGVKFFDNIKITDLDGNAFTEANPAVKDAEIKIHFDWSLDDDVEILDGDTYTYQLPEYFSVHNPVEGELYDEVNQLVMGKFSLDVNGKLTVTFNGNGTNLSVREGTIDLRTELKVTDEKEKIEIVTDIEDEDGQDITIHIPIAKGDIHKEGAIDTDNTVIWTITINRDRQPLKNVVVTDYIPEGLTMWYDSFYLQNEAGEWVTTDKFQNKQVDSKTYQYIYKDEILNVPAKIVVRMKVADKEKIEFLNKATIEGDNFRPNSSEASISFNEKANYKKLLDYNLDKGIFNWEVKATFTQSGGIFKDWMYSKYGDPNTAVHFLKEGTMKIFDADGNEIAAEDWEFVTTPESEFKQKDGKYVHFTLKFKNPGVYTIKYSTEAFETPVKPGTEVANFATIIDGETKEDLTAGEVVKVNGELGVKKWADNKDYTNSTIDYTVEINTNKIFMKNAVITDRFESLNGKNKSAMQLIEATLKLKTADGTLLTASDYELQELPGDPDYKTGFVVKLKGAYAETRETIIMTYTARYFIDEQEKNEFGVPNIRFDNSALISYTGEDGATHTDGSEVAFWVDAILRYNGVKFGTYVAKDGDVAKKLDIYNLNPFSDTKAPVDSVYWSAIFNLWNTKIPKDTTIREALGEGQDLREIVIYDVGLSSAATKINELGTKWQENTDYKITYDDGVPVIQLLKDKTKMFAVFVSADASEEVYKYKNVATMTVPGGEPLKVEGPAEKSDKDAWIDKNGQQGIGDDYRLINWSVVLNKDGHKVVQPYIEDTIDMADQTFVYDADKNVVVKVYKAKDDGAGGFEKDGEAIVFDEENRPVVTTDLAEGTQTLTIKLGDSINSPYIIEYQTMLDPDIGNNEKVSNKAILFGKDISIQETSKEVVVKSTNGEGTSSGKNGSLEFRKLDENKELITSDSAFFDLYRKDKEGNLTLMLSNIEVKGDKIIEDGTEVDNLSKLRYGKYVVVESKAPDGYVKDDTEYEFEIDKDHVEYTFTLENKRESNSLDTKIELAAQKELSGRPLENKEFCFNLKGDGVDQTVKNDEDGKIVFDEIYYLAEGTHEYTISEVIPFEKETGITYDETKYKVTVTVEEKAGKLEATAVYENVKAGEVPVFKNAYKALPTSIKLEAKKELEGRKLKNEEFSFNLKGDNVDQTKQNDLDGKVEFDEITYSEEGVHEYTISEVIPSEKETGITYDETKYKVTVTVEEKAGKLEATAVYENVKAGEVPVFKNTYKALPTSIKLEAKKELDGRKLKNEEFSFNLKGDNVDQTKQNDLDGKVEFDEITYSEEGTHEYTISEVIPSEKETGITYDETKYKVTVTVEEKAGKLKATAVYENVKSGEVPVFKNAYKALPTSIKLEAKKELEGRKLKNEEFSFNLQGDNVDQTKQNDLDGKVEFDEINYDQAGTYEYTISEVIPSEKETGITYDDTKYKVTVTVKEESGELKATAVYENVKAGEVPIFKNTYKVLPTSIKLEAQKELSGRELKNKEFSFNLKGDDLDQTVKNDENGKVTFAEINYTKAGTYNYTISEVIPEEKNPTITYDDTGYKVIVTVAEKAGKLEASVDYENVKANEVPTFKNLFTPEKKVPTGEILLKKVDSKTGKTLADAEFKLVDEKGQPVAGHEKIVTSADGTIFIKGLTDGNYQLIETKAPKGYQLDETPIEFTVKNSQPSKKEIKKENTRINLPDTGDSSDPKTNNAATNTHTTYRNGSASSSATSKRLPSTGSVRSNGLIILGLFFLAMIALVIFGKRKKV
ncbi:Spy0128 family protein [Enterococcus hulanensis]|uniref:Spy0128 family protein n=1 Tax=Enterococcus hulanensis TaxID=2559929 RepID=UPI0010F830B2|nr:FctA domain-containing protein [Enterococcus hulanensis]